MSQPPENQNPQQPTQPQQPSAPQPPSAPQQPSAPQPPQYAPPAQQPYGQQPYGQQAPPPPAYGQPAQPQYAAPQYTAPQFQYPPAPPGTIPGPGGYFDGATDPEDISRPLYGASFGQAVRRFFKQYANFTGRASRSEYWWVALFIFLVELVPLVFYIIGIVTISVSAATSSYDSYGYTPSAPSGVGLAFLFLGIGLLFVIGLALLVPSIALAWRRLHDGNFAGPMYFLSFIPYAGGIVLLVFMLLPSKTEGRRFDQVNA